MKKNAVKLGSVSMKEEDSYSDWQCSDDARKVMDVLELMSDDKKWKKIKAHLDKKKRALTGLDALKSQVEAGES